MGAAQVDIVNRASKPIAARGALRSPLAFASAVLLIITAFLALDHFATLPEQVLIGLATWGALLVACAPLNSEGRARVALVVVVATGAEILGSIILGAYEYRLANLPAFVPPGHGLVYLAGLGISQSDPVRLHRRAFLGAVMALVAVWGLAGVALLARPDVLGAICAALLIFVLVKGRAPTLYAGVFLIVGFLELYGTAIGAWQWAEMFPGTTLPVGNPPSGIASIYVLFDISAIALAPRLLAALHSVRRLRPRLAS